jgi:hypothetical protein
VKLDAVRSSAFEARSLLGALGARPARATGGVVVSGMLAEQLARQLSAGASPGAVTVGDGLPAGPNGVLVRVIAGDPSDEDRALVRAADADGVPVVLVQLWPQEDWAQTFVLTPFVVECRAGEGFPVDEIAARLAEAAEEPDALAARVPVLREHVTTSAVRESVLRAALLGALGARRGASRPLITLEQARLAARLQSTSLGAPEGGLSPVQAGTAAALLASGLAFREAARALRGTLPEPVANAAVAAAGTWLLGAAIRRLDARLAGV